VCGIIGSIGQEITIADVESLRHRGPDGKGIERIEYSSGHVWLGHARLAILDLTSAGHQPMRSRNGRWWLTYNGEIYNHLELRKEIAGPFIGHSDTETLLELIAAFGVEKAVNRLNGMYAFAVYDAHDSKLYIIRDPFGIKPLYYWQQGRCFAFSSEIRTLARITPESGIDPQGLRRFLTLRYVPSPATLWKGVKRLPPGYILEFNLRDSGINLFPFSRPTKERFTGTLEDAIVGYHTTLKNAVVRQMQSDVPVGILLSGGIDSALVAAMVKEAGYAPSCFTVGFGTAYGECEIDAARQTAKLLGLPFNMVTVTPAQLQVALPNIVRSIEEPLGTTSIMAMWYLVKKARETVTVALTGQGSDELWGGYFRYQLGLLHKMIPCTGIWKAGQRLSRNWNGRPDALERGLRALSEEYESGRIVEACALFSKYERRELLDGDDGGAAETINNWLHWLDSAGKLSGVERMMRLDSRMNLSDDLLLYGDKISMASSLETRVPMLDLELVRFVESLPIEYRIRWRQGKIVHKSMAERFLPVDIINRPKKGFQVPFGTWSRGIWMKWIECLLLEGLDQLLNRNAVEHLWKQHLSGRPDRSRQIFSLLMLALWWQEMSV